MAFLPTLLSCLVMFLPCGRTAPELSRVTLCVPLPLGAFADCGDLIAYPADFPPHSEKLFERMVETALDEEDSTQMEDRGLIASVLLDRDTTLVPLQLLRPAPPSGRSPRRIASPLLRC